MARSTLLDRWLPVRTPSRPQFQTTECGVAVLRILLAHFGREVPVRDLRRLTGVSRDGVSAVDIKRAAEACGLPCRILRLEPDRLSGERLPLVAHLGFIHFVVVEAIGPGEVRLNCPLAGRVAMPRLDFDRQFTGIAIVTTADPDVLRRGRQTSPEAVWWRARLASGLPALALGGAAATVRGGAVVWIALRLSEDGSPFGTAMPGLGLFALSAGLSRWASRQAGGRFADALRDDVADRLQDVPAAFHSYRLPVALFALLEEIRSGGLALSERVAPAAAALPEVAVLLLGAARISAVAAAGLVLAVAAWGLMVTVLGVWRRRRERSGSDGTAADIEAAVSALMEPGHCRFGPTAEAFRMGWLGRLAWREIAGGRTRLIDGLLAAAPATLLLGGLGAVAMSVPQTSAAAAPLALLAGAIAVAAAPLANLRGVIAGLRRIGDKAADVLDEPVEAAPRRDGPPRRAGLALRNVAFRFNPNGPPVIDGVSLEVAEGEQVGLGGPSGRGKSTLAGLAVGLHRPEAGEVTFAGLRLDGLCPARRARLVALVDRAPVVFEGTVRENLVLGDPQVGEADLRAAVADSRLDAVLAARPGGLEAPVEVLGRNFSGGELRRLEIARALARNPRLLVLDDAVDDLDLATEMAIRAALRRRGCALLLLTHRAASLAACDRVVQLDCPTPAARAAPAPVRGRDPVWDLDAALIEAAQADGIAAALEAAAPVRQGAPPTETAPLPCDRHGHVLEAARRRGLAARPVQLHEADLFRFAFGPLLAFRRDGTPMLMSGGDAGARIRAFGPGRCGVARGPAVAERLDEAGLPILAPVAYEITARPEPAPTQLRAWGAALRAGGARDRAVLAVSAAASSVSLVLATLFAGSGAPVPGVLALSAAGCFWRQRQAAADRREAAIRRLGAGAMLDLLGRARGDLGRRRGPGDLALATRTLLDGIDRAASRAGRAIPAAILAGLALAAIAATGGAVPALCALGLGGATLLAALGGRAANRAGEARLVLAESAARRRLVVLLFGMAKLRLLGADRLAFRRWRAEDDAAEAARRGIARRQDVAEALRQASALGLAASLAQRGGPARGMALAALGWLLAFALQEIGRLVTQDGGSRVARDRAAELLRAPRDAGRTGLGPGQARCLAVAGAAYRYPGTSRRVLSGLDLAIDLDRITVMTGPSGGGKTTALHLALGLITPEAGAVSLSGHPLATVDLALWRRRIGAVFQGDLLAQTSTIRGHLCGTGQHGVAAMWDALAMVDLDDEVSTMPMGLQTIVGSASLSAGQQQRLLIARALLGQPRLLVLDEALNAVPDALQARLLARLREHGIGCLAVTHRETLVMAADAVHVIDGTCRFSGSPADLVRRPDLLARLSAEQDG